MQFIRKKKNNKTQLVGILELILLVLLVTIVTFTFYININNKAIEKELIQLNEKVTETKASITIIQEYIAGIRESQIIDRTSMTEAESNALMSTLDVIEPIETSESEREVIFSNYSIDDESGVNESGALGIGIKDFNVNDEGWYEYEGKVALACAMERRGGVSEKVTNIGNHLKNWLSILKEKTIRGFALILAWQCWVGKMKLNKELIFG